MINKRKRTFISNLLLSIFAIFILYSASPSFWFGMTSNFWNQANGVVLKTTLQEKEGRGKGLYYPKVTYEYLVGEEKYINNVLEV